MGLQDKVVAYRKIQPVFNEIRGIRKQIEGAYSLSRDLLEETQAKLHSDIVALAEKHFTISPRRGYAVVTFKE